MRNHASRLLLAFFPVYLGLAAGCAPPEESLPPVSASAATTSGPMSGEAIDATDTSVASTPSADEENRPVQETPGSEASPSEVVVTLADYEQQQAIIKKQAGKVVVMDIWSTSCVPCMREFPNLVALSAKYPEQLACISLNVDYIGLKSKPPESFLPKVSAFLEKQQAAITNLISTARDEEILTKVGVSAIPAILVYDQQGVLHKTLTDGNAGVDGLTYEGDVIPVVEQLISESRG
jgi:thiol-disulfide isomerase/thioredoxin